MKLKPLQKITWKSPSNIALIKYWGKHGNQLPNNASLSFSLSEAYTITTIELLKKKSKKDIEFEFLFHGEKLEHFQNKIQTYLESLKKEISIISNYKLVISSQNSFPHSAGIASSASSMSALALCLCSLQNQHEKNEKKRSPTSEEYNRYVSSIARLGSGSAARSMYGHFSVWGKNECVKNARDEYAISFPEIFHSDFDDLQDTILIISNEVKHVSSRAGHALMNHHPMEKQRYLNANKRLADILLALKKGDWNLFCETTEAEALELHALMMTSSPSFILMKPNTLEVIERIRTFRRHTKIPVCFTLDAGPNVHIIYPYNEKKNVRNFIQSELLKYCVKKMVIYDSMGKGPSQIIDES